MATTPATPPPTQSAPSSAPVAPMQMTPDQFSQHIKSIYPGYDDIDNSTLTQRVLAKYPQWQVMVQGVQNKADAFVADPANFPQGPLGTMGQHLAQGAAKTVEGAVMHPVQTAQAMGQQVVASGINPSVPGMPLTAPTGNPAVDAQNDEAKQMARQAVQHQADYAKTHKAETVGGLLGGLTISSLLGDLLSPRSAGVAEASEAAEGAGATVSRSKPSSKPAQPSQVASNPAAPSPSAPTGKAQLVARPAVSATAPPDPISGEARANFANFLTKVGTRMVKESQGQEILDDMTEAKESPAAVSDKFWKDTYFKLPAAAQQRFTKMLQDVSGLQPGDVLAVRPDGGHIVAKDWAHIAEGMLPDSAETLQGPERGLVALMKVANIRALKDAAGAQGALGTGGTK